MVPVTGKVVESTFSTLIRFGGLLLVVLIRVLGVVVELLRRVVGVVRILVVPEVDDSVDGFLWVVNLVEEVEVDLVVLGGVVFLVLLLLTIFCMLNGTKVGGGGPGLRWTCCSG